MDIVEIAANNGIDVWAYIKWIYMLAFAVYFVFSIIAWRQIDLMSRSLNGSMHLPIRLVGVGLVSLAGVSMVVAMMVL